MALTIGLAIVAFVAGTTVAFLIYLLGGKARPKVTIDLKETGRVDPATVGAYFEMRIGARRVKNLVLLELTVSNKGFSDAGDNEGKTPDSDKVAPRIELPMGVRALIDPWTPDEPLTSRDVRVARNLEHDRQMLYVHVHRLVRRSEVRTRIVCHYIEGESHPPITAESVRFYPGYIRDTKVVPSGLLVAPPSMLSS